VKEKKKKEERRRIQRRRRRRRRRNLNSSWEMNFEEQGLNLINMS
jgi:hypothetical protein